MRQFIKKYPYVLWVLYLPVYLVLFFIVEQVITIRLLGLLLQGGRLDSLLPGVCGLLCHVVPAGDRDGSVSSVEGPEGVPAVYVFRLIGLTVSLLICLVFPNGQDLRPTALGNDIFSQIMRLIYAADTNTNVLPSMHVVGTCAVIAAWYHTEVQHKWVLPAILILGLLINVSTVLVKQHSFLDIIAGVVLSAVVYVISYRLLPVPELERIHR